MFGILEVEKVIEKEQKRGQRGRGLPIGSRNRQIRKKKGLHHQQQKKSS